MQLKRLRRDLKIVTLRGNLDTRIRKLEEGQYDAIVLAAAGLKRLGKKRWRKEVVEVVERLRAALEPDYVVLGGGNLKKLDRLPPGCRRGDNANAFKGGFRIWQKDGVQI